MKTSVSTTLEEEVVERVDALAKADDSTQARILRKAIIKGLPLIEQDVLGQDFVGGSKAPKRKLSAAA